MAIGSDKYWAGKHDRPLVVVAAATSWDGVKGSDHQIAKALSEHADVLWVDPPVSPVTPDRYTGTKFDSGRSVFFPELSPLSASVVRLATVGPPGLSRPGIRSLTWQLVRAQIRWALRRTGRRPDVFVACHQHDLLGRWGENVVDVLYGTDDVLAGAALLRQDPRRVLEEEKAALGRADLVLAVGPELADRWRALGADPVLFSNGCDFGAYVRVEETEPGPVPAGFPTPVAGIVGQLNERIDVNLLSAVADTGVGLLLVGPRNARWSPARTKVLLARPNVHHVGAVPFEELPRWLARIDVGLTPYTDSGFNRASFPLKTLEYLAAGLPVVSTDLPASRWLRQQTTHVWIASEPWSFADAVLQAAGSPNGSDAVAQRRAVAERHSWAARAEQFVRLAGLSA